MTTNTSITGTVKWFNNDKGFGFITTTTGADYFVHHTGIDAQGYRSLNQGEAVTFNTEVTDRGPKAVNVKVVAAA